jgi:hypothetical protein
LPHEEVGAVDAAAAVEIARQRRGRRSNRESARQDRRNLRRVQPLAVAVRRHEILGEGHVIEAEVVADLVGQHRSQHLAAASKPRQARAAVVRNAVGVDRCKSRGRVGAELTEPRNNRDEKHIDCVRVAAEHAACGRGVGADRAEIALRARVVVPWRADACKAAVVRAGSERELHIDARLGVDHVDK